jgi:diaminopimelate decarboxylase
VDRDRIDLPSSLDAASAERIAARYGTPFYLYDVDLMRERLEALRAGLGDAPVSLYFAVKANPCPGLLSALAPHIDGADVSSLGEIELAAATGVPAERQSWAGPGKRAEDLRAGISAGVGVISVESAAELARLETVARELDRPASVTLRLNPLEVSRAFPMKMGGRPSPFGIPIEEVDAPLRRAIESDALKLCGFHIYAGTQCLDEDALLANIDSTLTICAELAEQHGLEPELLNLGGGFGVPHFADEEPLDLKRLSARLGELLAGLPGRQPRLAGARLILELGRFICGPAGSYVCRVIEVKQSRGKRFCLLDGGMHHLFAATGNFGQLIKRNYRVTNLSAQAAKLAGRPREQEHHELAGPLCTPLDSLGRKLSLPRCEAGDLLAFGYAGAYGYSASPLLFLGHPTPAELLRSQGEVRVGRAAGRLVIERPDA